MSTALVRMSGEKQSNALTMYDRISDPIAFMTQVGEVFFRTAVAGVKSQQEGQLLALVCLMENKSPFEINREFHLMDGKLTMRADAMLSRFRMLGGKHQWVKDGADGVEAELHLTLDGKTTTVKYSMAEARAAGYVKKGGAWEKNPGNMLRARCSSNGVRMVAPEVISGYYTPEEMEDETGTSAVPATRSSKPKADVVPAATVPAATTPVVTTTPEPVTEAAFEPVAETTPAATPTVTAPEPVATTPVATDAAAPPANDSAAKELILAVEARDNLVKFLASAGIAPEALESQLRAANPKFVSLDHLSSTACNGLLNNLRAQLKK